jgi:hypothetical protein
MTMTNDEAGRIVSRWVNKENVAKGRALPTPEEFATMQQNQAAAQSTLPAYGGNGWAVGARIIQGGSNG